MLYFKTGVMGSTKTLNLISVAFNYEEKGMTVGVFKPEVDTRIDNKTLIVSRTGAQRSAVPFDSNFNFEKFYSELPHVIIIDECQFLTVEQVEQLYRISEDIPVLCYGLKTDFKTEMFPASKRILELCDSIEEFKSICRCGHKAKFNARLENGKVITTGQQVGIEGDFTYESLCRFCYNELKGE